MQELHCINIRSYGATSVCFFRGVKSGLCERQDTYFDFTFLELQRLSRVSQPGVDRAQLGQLKAAIVQNLYICVRHNKHAQLGFQKSLTVTLNVLKD